MEHLTITEKCRKYTLEKIKEVITNKQSRDTGNIGRITHRTTKHQNTIQKTKRMSKTDPPPKTNRWRGEWRLQDVFNEQGAWHFPSTLPTVVHGQSFQFITKQPPHRHLKTR